MSKRLLKDLIHGEAQNAYIVLTMESICNEAMGQISIKLKGNSKFYWYPPPKVGTPARRFH